jgi:hypothetical protein
MVAACREERKAGRHDAAVRAFVTKPHRGIFCGLARNLPPASGEGITSHNSMQHIAPERSAGNRPCRRPPLAESGRIRRRCMVHQLCDVIASRARDRPQSCCSLRAGARVVLFVTMPTAGRVCLQGGLFLARRRWKFKPPGAVARLVPCLPARSVTLRRIGLPRDSTYYLFCNYSGRRELASAVF